MITEWFVDLGLGFFDLLVLALPEIKFDGFVEAYTYFFSFLTDVCYFLPMDTVSAIFSMIYAFFVLRLLIATFKTIWGIIPIL